MWRRKSYRTTEGDLVSEKLKGGFAIDQLRVMTGGRSTSISTVVLQRQWVIFPSGWEPAPPLQVSCLDTGELLQLVRPHFPELRCLCCLSSPLPDKCHPLVSPPLVKICSCAHPLSALWAWLPHIWKRTSEKFPLVRFSQALPLASSWFFGLGSVSPCHLIWAILALCLWKRKFPLFLHCPGRKSFSSGCFSLPASELHRTYGMGWG